MFQTSNDALASIATRQELSNQFLPFTMQPSIHKQTKPGGYYG